MLAARAYWLMALMAGFLFYGCPLYGWKGKVLWGEAAGPAALCAALVVKVLGGLEKSGEGCMILTAGLFLFYGLYA